MDIEIGSILGRTLAIAKKHSQDEKSETFFRNVGLNIVEGMSEMYVLTHYMENPWLLQAPIQGERFGEDYHEDSLKWELQETLVDCIVWYLENGTEGLEHFWEEN